MLKCTHFKSPQSILRIANPHHSSHLRRTLKPCKNQAVTPILALGMTPHKTLPRWYLKQQPSRSPSVPHVTHLRFNRPSLPRGNKERSGLTAPIIVASPPPKWTGLKLSFSITF